MDLPNTRELLNKIIEVGKRGFCTSTELDYFLPEILKLRNIRVADVDFPDLIRGYHLIEMGYRVKSGNNIGFGSSSKTSDLIRQLVKVNKDKAIELYNWMADNGGNYYITADISYERRFENEAGAARKREDILVNDQNIHLEAVAKKKKIQLKHSTESDNTNKLYQEYVSPFQKMNDDELIKAFNKEVNNPGWVRRRGIYLAALHKEFENRGFDYSTVGGKGGLMFSKKIKIVGKKIITSH